VTKKTASSDGAGFFFIFLETRDGSGYWLLNPINKMHGDSPYLPLLILEPILQEVFQLNFGHTLL
jgi:hypothetical protein